MSSEEEDYMSDIFLQKCENLRPGLAPKHVQKQREKTIEEENLKKKNPSFIPKRKLESHQRETGLNTEISSSSKGFLLLQKMGYKPGTGIGKSGEGRTEPIRIEVKCGREGLGRDMERKRKTNEMNARSVFYAAKKQKYAERQTHSFLSRMKDKFAEKSLEKDLRTAQTTCLQLDQQQGIEVPDQSFFWPLHSIPATMNEDEEEEEEVDEHARVQHIRKDRLRDDSDSDLDEVAEFSSQSELSELSVSDKLEMLTEYLRGTYKYCIWCGTAFDDEEELMSQCPGNSAEDHN